MEGENATYTRASDKSRACPPAAFRHLGDQARGTRHSSLVPDERLPGLAGPT